MLYSYYDILKRFVQGFIYEGKNMEKLLQLRPIEKDFKKYYEDTGFITTMPLDFEKIPETLREKHASLFRIMESGLDEYACSQSLAEEQYFQVEQDISAIQHARYMPAITHTHDFFEVACVLSGTFTHFTGKQKMQLNSGDIVILAPDTEHSICTYQDGSILINILMRSSTFEQHFLRLLPDNDILSSFFVRSLYGSSDTPYLLFRTRGNPELSDLAIRILREYQRNNRYKNTMLSSLVSVFFVQLLRKHEKDVVIPSMHASVMNETTIFIIEYMQKNYATLTLSHLAAFFNYSTRQMQRILTTATGMTFSENIRRLRMAHASDLLTDSQLTIQKIADVLGYYDVSNFRKVFRNTYGMTPQEYREKHRKSQPPA